MFPFRESLVLVLGDHQPARICGHVRGPFIAAARVAAGRAVQPLVRIAAAIGHYVAPPS